MGSALREMPGGARHEAVEISNSLQSGCAEDAECRIGADGSARYRSKGMIVSYRGISNEFLCMIGQAKHEKNVGIIEEWYRGSNLSSLLGLMARRWRIFFCAACRTYAQKKSGDNDSIGQLFQDTYQTRRREKENERTRQRKD